MYNDFNYPAGADTPDAPWNRGYNEKEGVEVDVLISSTLSKETKISTTDYTAEEWEDCETDDDGCPHRFGGVDYDFSDTNFQKEYNEEHLTPLELINEFRNFLTTYCPDPVVDMKKYKKFQHLIKECNDWQEDEIEVIKN